MIVNAADYGMSPSASPSVNKAALLAAMDAGRAVSIPAGEFEIDGGIEARKTNQVIFGAGPADAYNYSYGPTTLQFENGSVGFDMQSFFNYTPAIDYGSGMNSEYGALHNLNLDGGGNVDNLIKFKGQKRFKGLNVTNFKTAGIWGVDWLNFSVIEDCSIFNYASRGASWGATGKFVGTGIRLDGAGSTCTFISRVRARCTGTGMLLRGFQGGSVRDSVIESNSNIGMLIEAYDGTGNVRNLIENVWFENNAEYAEDGSLYQLALRDYSTDPIWRAQHNRFVNCNFSHPSTAHQKTVLVDASVIGTSFDNCSFASAPVVNDPSTKFTNCIGVPDTGAVGSGATVVGGVETSGQTAPSIIFTPGQVMTLATDGVGSTLCAAVKVYNANSGHVGFFMATAGTVLEVADSGGMFVPNTASGSSCFNIWSDVDGHIYIKNNFSVNRHVSISVSGAKVTAVA